jgi:plastocyanin
MAGLQRHRRPGPLALAGGILLALGAGGIAAAWAAGPASPGGASVSGEHGPVEIRMRYSAFSVTEVTVRAGQPLTVVLTNGDPIDHEWMVGDAAFHERHRSGTEPVHASRPTEVTVPAGASRTTTVTFRVPGEYPFICHLPGHEAYGMVGVVRVLPSS